MFSLTNLLARQSDTVATNTRFSHMCRLQMASKRQRAMPTSHAEVLPHSRDPLDRVSCEDQRRKRTGKWPYQRRQSEEERRDGGIKE